MSWDGLDCWNGCAVVGCRCGDYGDDCDDDDACDGRPWLLSVLAGKGSGCDGNEFSGASQ